MLNSVELEDGNLHVLFTTEITKFQIWWGGGEGKPELYNIDVSRHGNAEKSFTHKSLVNLPKFVNIMFSKI